MPLTTTSERAPGATRGPPDAGTGSSDRPSNGSVSPFTAPPVVWQDAQCVSKSIGSNPERSAVG